MSKTIQKLEEKIKMKKQAFKDKMNIPITKFKQELTNLPRFINDKRFKTLLSISGPNDF